MDLIGTGIQDLIIIMSINSPSLEIGGFQSPRGEPSSSTTASPSTPFSQITQQNSNFEAYGTTLITTRSEPQNDLSAKFQQQKDESALRKRSDREIEDSQKSTNPRLSSSKPLLPRVQQESVGITLTQIFDMDEKNQVMTTNVWLDQEWVMKCSYGIQRTTIILQKSGFRVIESGFQT
ncbi:unnamed protein product [Lepeophtheirus salmonis]|uniref:(salmon louse) hypothetical protein n=1 Tax=Lepeophtheirus salmonis TaxID=72036 RepID=A0A7R8D2U2_LEPSM|nr:unnamed protein product [Lepeophtheirus salmonis]CAF3008912.1 unnamed protein product [Lepeophtheirus salmonis]